MEKKLKIGLLGYGKMGQAIDALAEQHGCTVVWRIGRSSLDTLSRSSLQQADVVIEFTQPNAGFQNTMLCLEAGIPVVSGTTGWQDQLPTAAAFAHQNNGALLWASNFSIGVNLFFALNQYLARLMSGQDAYKAALTEIHHIHKLDAPSGTAVTIAEGIIQEHQRYNDWTMDSAQAAHELPIVAVREGEVPGTHTVEWTSPVDTIRITHEAHSRTGFAIGALLAAQWLHNKTGVFSMQDVVAATVPR